MLGNFKFFLCELNHHFHPYMCTVYMEEPKTDIFCPVSIVITSPHTFQGCFFLFHFIAFHGMVSPTPPTHAHTHSHTHIHTHTGLVASVCYYRNDLTFSAYTRTLTDIHTDATPHQSPHTHTQANTHKHDTHIHLHRQDKTEKTNCMSRI